MYNIKQTRCFIKWRLLNFIRGQKTDLKQTNRFECVREKGINVWIINTAGIRDPIINKNVWRTYFHEQWKRTPEIIRHDIIRNSRRRVWSAIFASTCETAFWKSNSEYQPNRWAIVDAVGNQKVQPVHPRRKKKKK